MNFIPNVLRKFAQARLTLLALAHYTYELTRTADKSRIFKINKYFMRKKLARVIYLFIYL